MGDRPRPPLSGVFRGFFGAAALCYNRSFLFGFRLLRWLGPGFQSPHRKADALIFRIDRQHLRLDRLPFLHDVRNAVHAFERQFGNVNQPFHARL